MWVIFALLDPDPDPLTRLNPDPQPWFWLKNFKFFSTYVGHFCPPGSGSGSTDPIKSGSSPDPQPWFWLKNFKIFSTYVGHFCPPGSGSGSTDPIKSGSNPDPQPWFWLKNFPVFGHQNPGSGSVFSQKCWIRIRIKWMRIRNHGRNHSIFEKRFFMNRS